MLNIHPLFELRSQKFLSDITSLRGTFSLETSLCVPPKQVQRLVVPRNSSFLHHLTTDPWRGTSRGTVWTTSGHCCKRNVYKNSITFQFTFSIEELSLINMHRSTSFTYSFHEVVKFNLGHKIFQHMGLYGRLFWTSFLLKSSIYTGSNNRVVTLPSLVRLSFLY